MKLSSTRVNSFIYKTVNFDFRFTKSMTFYQTHLMIDIFVSMIYTNIH